MSSLFDLPLILAEWRTDFDLFIYLFSSVILALYYCLVMGVLERVENGSIFTGQEKPMHKIVFLLFIYERILT